MAGKGCFSYSSCQEKAHWSTQYINGFVRQYFIMVNVNKAITYNLYLRSWNPFSDIVSLITHIFSQICFQLAKALSFTFKPLLFGSFKIVSVVVICRLWKCASVEVMQSIVQVMASCDPELVAMRRHILIQYVYMVIKEETKWEEVHTLGSSIPPLTVKQVLFNLMTLLHIRFKNVLTIFNI